MTRVVFKIVDAYGNRLPYTNQVVSFEVDGPGELMGENPFALMGGGPQPASRRSCPPLS